jgi:hypothetical protein
MLQVFKPGTTVTVGDDVPAIVRQACIAADGVTYEVAWWSDRTRIVQWLSEHEVKARDRTELRKVGFVNG